MEVVKGGGIVRAIHNHGIRNLPHRFRAKYADKEGNRYYSKGRFISIYYDSNPSTMKQVEQTLTMQEEVLRNTHLKARSVLDYVNISREERNPYISQVKVQQALDRSAIHHRNETVEQVIEDMRMDDV
jgi:ribosomal protein S6